LTAANNGAKETPVAPDNPKKRVPGARDYPGIIKEPSLKNRNGGNNA